MIQRKTLRVLTESILLALAPAGASVFLGDDPGFLALHGAPVLAAGPLFAAFYGFRWGLAETLMASVAGFVIAPALAGRLQDAVWLAMAADRLFLGVATSLPVFFLLAFARRRAEQFRARMLGRFRLFVKRNAALDRKVGALESVNRVLENRVSGQKDSITLLHNQVRKLASLNLERALATVLETVELFTETSSSSIWRLEGESGKLVPAAVRGWTEGEERSASLDPELSIEGYVLRNKKPFSARMILDGSEFDRYDTDRNIITMPIIIKDKAWGVLNIEDLPFERYSLYTESVLAILLGLSEPYLRAIMEYESMHALQEVDEDTGYPEFSILYNTLAKELERFAIEPGSLTLIIVEMANFEEELGRRTRAELKRLLFSVKDTLEEAKGVKFRSYHFKNDNQLALLVEGMDKDGASFFCLDILSLCSSLAPSVGGKTVPLEIIVGFSIWVGGSGGADAMIETAEHLLSIQRL